MRAVPVIVLLVLLATLWYLTLPVLSFSFQETWLLLAAVLFGLGSALGIRSIATRKPSILTSIFWFSALVVLMVQLVIGVMGMPIFSASRLRNLIGNVPTGKFTADISPIDLQNVRLVDEEMANRLGEKELGKDPALGSRAELGDFAIQSIKGKLYWVAPLVHTDFWKWITFGSTPGYVKVSATNPDDVTLITQINGRNLEIRYMPEAFFHQDLARRVYFSGYMTRGLTDYTFEVDDAGNPYWVLSIYHPTIGFRGDVVTGCLIVNAETGEIDEYGIENIPKWVDRIQPEKFIIEQVYDWGEYVHGFWNWSQMDKVRPASEHLSLVYGEDEKSYWYVGLTSTGRDQSTIGFLLIDTRTKATKQYLQSGATEEAAMHSAEGKVQEKGYRATHPITYNIDGVPTYIMSLKDKAGLIKQVAMVSIENYSLVATGETPKDALKEYRSLLRNSGNTNINLAQQINLRTITGKIKRFTNEVRQGNTFYNLLIDSADSLIFTGTSNLNTELAISQVGDSVKVSYHPTNDPEIEMTQFDNLLLRVKPKAANK